MFQLRLDLLKKQTFEEMKAETERVCQEKADSANEKMCSLRRIKIRWKANKKDASNGGYNEEILKNIFSKVISIIMLEYYEKQSIVSSIQINFLNLTVVLSKL